MPDPVRQLSVPPLAGLEGQRCGALGGGGAAVLIPHSFPLRPSSNQGSHLHASLPPFVHQKGGSGGGYSGPCGQECGGACSSPFPRLLQPAFLCVEDLRVLETRHRSLDPQSLRGCVALPHGNHPVCPSLCSSGRLDGLHRPQGILPAGSCPSGLSALPSVCGSGQCLPVLCPLLRPLHGSTGLLMGHGSCFRHSPFLGYPHEAVPRRLASPVVLSRVSPSRPQGGPRSLPRTGDCSESSEVPPRSFPGRPVSRGGGGLAIFPGFSIAGTRRQASVNSQRISLLRRSSSEYLALAARHTVLSLPSRSWRPPPGEVSPAVSPPGLGLGGPVSQDSLGSSLPPGSSVVARPGPSETPGSGVSGSGLLVRRLRRGLGSSSGFSHRFRPLGCRASRSVHQRSEASGHQGGSPPLLLFSGREECGGILRQLHSSVVSPQGGRHTAAVPQLPGSGDSPLDGVPLLQAVTPVHSGVPERSGGLSLSRPHQLPHTEWSLHPEVFRSISRMWPVQLDLFATSANRQCSIFFSPFRDLLAAGTDAFLQRWDGLQAYAFPPWSVIPRVLAKLRLSPGTELTLIAPYWPQRAWFSDLLHLSLAPPVALPLRRDLLRLPQSHDLYQGLHRLRLHAWRLSGASRELQDSHSL